MCTLVGYQPVQFCYHKGSLSFTLSNSVDNIVKNVLQIGGVVGGCSLTLLEYFDHISFNTTQMSWFWWLWKAVSTLYNFHVNGFVKFRVYNCQKCVVLLVNGWWPILDYYLIHWITHHPFAYKRAPLVYCKTHLIQLN